MDENGNCGFDFLGMNIRQFKAGKTHTGKNGQGIPLGFKTIIRPSLQSQKKQHKSLQNIIRKNRMVEQERLIEQLNPVIRGWSKFHSTCYSKQVFSNMDHKLFQSLRRWANRRHPNQSQTWANRKYWQLETGRWMFAVRKGKRLRGYAETPIVRHIKVAGTRTPYDGDWNYWGSRLGRYPTLSIRKAKLLKKQGGRCTKCRLQFVLGDAIDIDHIIPLNMGGKDEWNNLQLLHSYCHHQKTAMDNLLHND